MGIQQQQQYNIILSLSCSRICLGLIGCLASLAFLRSSRCSASSTSETVIVRSSIILQKLGVVSQIFITSIQSPHFLLPIISIRFQTCLNPHFPFHSISQTLSSRAKSSQHSSQHLELLFSLSRSQMRFHYSLYLLQGQSIQFIFFIVIFIVPIDPLLSWRLSLHNDEAGARIRLLDARRADTFQHAPSLHRSLPSLYLLDKQQQMNCFWRHPHSNEPKLLPFDDLGQ